VTRRRRGGALRRRRLPSCRESPRDARPAWRPPLHADQDDQLLFWVAVGWVDVARIELRELGGSTSIPPARARPRLGCAPRRRHAPPEARGHWLAYRSSPAASRGWCWPPVHRRGLRRSAARHPAARDVDCLERGTAVQYAGRAPPRARARARRGSTTTSMPRFPSCVACSRRAKTYRAMSYTVGLRLTTVAFRPGVSDRAAGR
jgi:hypothetical protein